MKKILVIEDNPLNMELITDILEVQGYEIHPYNNAEDGIRAVGEHMPDVILMDIQLPGMDGLTATKILKKESSTKDIPVLALTAHAMTGFEESALEAGCVGYITKPINTRTIVQQIADLC